jgi:protein-tyrosine-phosphatase
MPLLAFLAFLFQTQPLTSQNAAIVFVCEHGAAKSVIATAYFNKLAAERGLQVRATYRGSAPQEALSTRAIEGLKADGLAIPTDRPSAITDRDVSGAQYVFTIGCVLPRSIDGHGKVTDWSDVPDDQGYEAMRTAIVRHVNELLNSLPKK